jgi:hypothetical protein
MQKEGRHMECRTGVEKALFQMNEKYLIRRDYGISQVPTWNGIPHESAVQTFSSISP